LRHQTMDKVQKHNSFNTNTPSSESYRNYSILLYYSPNCFLICWLTWFCLLRSNSTMQ